MAVKSNRRDTCNLLIGLSGNGIKKISEPRQGRDKLLRRSPFGTSWYTNWSISYFMYYFLSRGSM